MVFCLRLSSSCVFTGAAVAADYSFHTVIFMRKFRCWIEWPFAGAEDSEEIIEVEDNLTDEEIEDECIATIETMYANEAPSGWEEVLDDD